MNMRFCKFLLAICVLPLFASTFPVAYAQDQTGQVAPTRRFAGAGFGGGGGFRGMGTNAVRFDVQIEDGQLSLAPLKGRVEVNDFKLGAGAQPADISSVPATIANLAKYIGAADTNGNINVSPSAAEIQINDLKLRGADVAEVLDAVSTATDGAVRGTGGFDRSDGRYDCAFQTGFQFQNGGFPMFGRPQNPPRTVEVFNMSGYIRSLPLTKPPPEAVVQRKIDDIDGLVRDTMRKLHQDDPKPPPMPEFNFHTGTGLLIVIGSPEAIEVTRKFVNALPGQTSGNQQAPLDNQATPQEK